jgi:hypothetical protein
MILYSGAQSGVRFPDAEAQRQIQAAENQITSYEVYRSRPSDSELQVKGLARFMSFDPYAGKKQEDFSAAGHQTPVP